MPFFRYLKIAGLTLFAIGTAFAGTATFDFTKSNSQNSSLTFSPYSVTDGGVTGLTVSVTAYATATNGTNLTAGSVVESTSGKGLGNCNATEDDRGCTTTEDQVSNSGQYEFLLFTFSTPVDLDSIVLYTSSGTDRDMSYWTSPNGFTFSDQTNQLCSSDCGSGKSSAESLNGIAVSELLVAALYGSGSGNDQFVVQQLKVGAVPAAVTATPEPATLGLFALALGGLALYRICRFIHEPGI